MNRVFDAFLVQQTTDERGSTGATVGYFTLEANADEAAKGQGWFGGQGSVSPVLMVEVDDQCFPVMRGHENGVRREFLNANLIERARDVRRDAWDKVGAVLSAEEIKLLGLKAPT